MIQIKPTIEHNSSCPYCRGVLYPRDILWQGTHVCTSTFCDHCQKQFVEDLRIGQAVLFPYQIDVQENTIFGPKDSMGWLGKPLLASLVTHESNKNILLTVESFNPAKKVIILNCIDFLYGHCLLKLLNAAAHLDFDGEYGLVVVVQKFLRWLVPNGIAEIWTVDLPLSQAQKFFPTLDQQIKAECSRFDEIYLSTANIHPRHFDIERFSGVAKHDFQGDEFRITFIWREDRPWCGSDFSRRLLNKLSLPRILLQNQKYKIIKSFSLLRQCFPQARYTVAGLGTSTILPKWIEDQRVERFDNSTEKNLCRVYAQSRLVIGVHGSNMLLPSAHAGLTIDLMPLDRWGNIAQDILYKVDDCRVAAHKYRFLPINVDLTTLAKVAEAQISLNEIIIRNFTIEQD